MVAAVLVLGAGGSPARDTIAGFAPGSLTVQRAARGTISPRCPPRRGSASSIATSPPNRTSRVRPATGTSPSGSGSNGSPGASKTSTSSRTTSCCRIPQEVRVEMTAPKPWQASLREDAVPGDPDTAQDPGPTYHAFSASGDVTGAGRLRRQREPGTLRLAHRPGHRSPGQDRARPLLGARTAIAGSRR